MIVKGQILMNVLPDVYICLLKKKSAPFPEGTVECVYLVA